MPLLFHVTLNYMLMSCLASIDITHFVVSLKFLLNDRVKLILSHNVDSYIFNHYFQPCSLDVPQISI